jgi:hypothetical protein
LRRRTFACLIAGLALVLVQASSAWAADKTLDLKVLVISTGNASVDPGLDLMDDLLNEVGVPYDVLDSSTDVLTPGRLSAGDHGFYNGVILTNSELFLPDGSGSGFNFLEWDVLHAFERDFGVRESVLSGFPATNPGLGLDYGMTDIIAGNDFQGVWMPPAGGTEIFEYVNEANPLPITDFAFAGRPFVVYAGEPRETGVGPHVQPLLNWQDDLSKTFVSHLRYDDGREVLLSTISNAWFLIHSQVLAYEFLNFATKGVFIGSREVYLESHVDDLFLENELWDPAANTTDMSRSFRMDAAAVQNTRASVDALRAEHPSAGQFTVDFAFNGSGAVPTFRARPDALLGSVADTFLRQNDPNENFGTRTEGEVRTRTGDSKRTLLRFDVSGLVGSTAEKATLTLFTDGSDEISAKICAVTSSWDEGRGSYNTNATWTNRKTGIRWTAAGGDHNASSCIPFRLRNERYVSVDITPIVAGWLAGAPNNGLIVIGTTYGYGEVSLREDSTSKRPSLAVKFAPELVDDPDATTDTDFRPVADTFLRQQEAISNFGTRTKGEVRLRSGENKRTLMRFNLAGVTGPAQSATLTLWSEGYDQPYAKICRVTSSWDEGSGSLLSGATWLTRRSLTPWSASGGDFDASSCVGLRLRHQRYVSVDVTPIVNSWLSGSSANNGLVIMGTSSGFATVGLREETTSKRPLLRVSSGANLDELTTAVVQNKDAFRFINHTYTHQDMDAGAGIADYEFSRSEILQNRDTWTRLGLPAKAENDPVLITGEHSGLRDRRGNEDPIDDVDYPAGINTQLMQAAQDAGVRYLASDASHLTQAVEALVPGFNILLLPRYPTAVFYNATTPGENTDEYNYIFHERFLEAGQDPCTIPGAICAPRTYEQILAAEADTTLRHMLSYKAWPHFFHQSNLRNYDGTGSTLLFDWLDAVLDRYERLMVLPVRSLPYYEIGKRTEQRLAARSAGVRGTINLTTNVVTLLSDNPATASVTGVAGGQLYGGQSIRSVAFGPAAQDFAVERALGH